MWRHRLPHPARRFRARGTKHCHGNKKEMGAPPCSPVSGERNETLSWQQERNGCPTLLAGFWREGGNEPRSTSVPLRLAALRRSTVLLRRRLCPHRSRVWRILVVLHWAGRFARLDICPLLRLQRTSRMLGHRRFALLIRQPLLGRRRSRNQRRLWLRTRSCRPTLRGTRCLRKVLRSRPILGPRIRLVGRWACGFVVGGRRMRSFVRSCRLVRRRTSFARGRWLVRSRRLIRSRTRFTRRRRLIRTCVFICCRTSGFIGPRGLGWGRTSRSARRTCFRSRTSWRSIARCR